MKILFLLRFFPVYGGGEAVTLRLANAFVKRGHSVGVFYLWDNYGKNTTFVSPEVKLFKISINIEQFYQGEFNKKDEKIIESELTKTITTFKPNIIINQWLPSTVVYKANNDISKIISCIHTSILGRNSIGTLKQKIIVKIIGRKIFSKLQLYKTKKVFKKLYNKSDAVIVLSKVYVTDLEKLLHVKKGKKKIFSIENPALFDNWCKIETLKEKDSIVLFVGRFSNEKRLDLLLQIWKKIEEYDDSNWKLILCGDGIEFDRIQNLAVQLNLKCIEFKGQCNPLEYYKKSKLILLTSSYEGFPMVLLEGQQNGCVPIVYDSFPALHDLITDNYNGIIIPNNNLELFAARMKDLMMNYDDYFLLAKNAVESSKKYSIDNIAERWESLFIQLNNSEGEL